MNSLHPSVLAALALFFAAQAQAAFQPPFKVVIDPGHGGSDHGTVYSTGTYEIAEKTVTLMLARQVAAQLRASGIDVTLTRRDDRDIPLGKRTEIANRLGADIFISIHLNSSQVPGAPGTQGPQGIETYILNNATDASSRRLAHLENTVISREGIRTPEQGDVALILRDLRLDANLSESKRLACAIQNNLAARDRKRNRGVKQSLFHVLLGADMPSVLLEAGFLSNLQDRQLVLSSDGRRAIAASITRAIQQYRTHKGTLAARVALSRCQVR